MFDETGSTIQGHSHDDVNSEELLNAHGKSNKNNNQSNEEANDGANS